jgi:alkylated DNA repair dioxygenase AlkB
MISFHDLGMNSARGTFILEFDIPEELLENSYEHFNAQFPNYPQEIELAGRNIVVPRNMVQYGMKEYTFGQKESIPKLTDNSKIEPIIAYVNDRLYELGINHRLDIALLNRYLNGTQYIGYHKDKTNNLQTRSPIVTITISADPKGEQRRFLLKNIITKGVTSFDTRHGQVIIMGGRCQETHEHCVPKIGAARALNVPVRIGITLRCMKK